MIKKILAIDPGSLKSAYVLYDQGKLLDFGIKPNAALLAIIRTADCECVAIEMIASYGMPVGKDVFETCVWIGRFIQVSWSRGKPFFQVYRKDVKMYLCRTPRAKDSNIRQAIIDLYPPTGEGAIPQIGTKKYPGPLYGVSKDVWAALAVALTFGDSTKAGTGN